MHETGKGKVEFVCREGSTTQFEAYAMQTQKELPVQFLSSPQPLRATLLLASFGSSRPFSNHIFNLDVRTDPNLPKPQYDKPLRYGKLPEIHHIFKADPKSGPIIISVFFVGLVLATLPLLLGTVSTLNAYFPTFCMLNSTLVGISRCKSESSAKGSLDCAHIPRSVLRFDLVRGSYFLVILP